MEDCVKQFIDISSNSSREVALYYLELSGQNVEQALNLFYQDKASGSSTSLQSFVGANSCAENSEGSKRSKKVLTILQWNIQGLLDTCIKERTVAVVQEIKRLSPDVVMMQEVIHPVLNYIRSACQPDYKLFCPFDEKPSFYFTLLMVKSSTFQVKSHGIDLFSSTKQGRNLTIVSGVFCGNDVTVMTSHLESTASEAPTRKRQLLELWETMKNKEPSHTVVFGGDTNLRDREVVDMKRKYPHTSSCIEDIWEKLGSAEETRYSWDCSKNDNQFQDSNAKLRFGRLYMRGERADSANHFRPLSMEFIGMERLPCGMFPSDHWGILVRMTAERSPDAVVDLT